MGYEIRVVESDVRIARKDEARALKKLQAATKAGAWETELDPRHALTILRAKTLDEALAVLGWEIHRDDGERIDGLDYEGKVSGNEQQLLNLLAPFVRVDSWIGVIGENDDAWRWVFDGEEAVEDWTDQDDPDE